MNNVTVLLKPVHAVRQCIDKGSFLKMTTFRQLIFTRVLELISSFGPINGMSLSDEAIKYVKKPKTNRVSLVRTDLNKIEQLVDELLRRIWDLSVQPQILRQLQIALHSELAWIPENVVRRHMLLVRPPYEAVIAAVEVRVCFWTTLTQVN